MLKSIYQPRNCQEFTIRATFQIFLKMIWKNFYQISIILKNEQKKREIRRIKELKSLEKKIVIVDCNCKKWFCSRNCKFWEGLAQLILEYFIRFNFLAFNAPLSHGTRPRKQFNSRRPIIRPETKARTLNFILHPWHHPPPPRIIPLMNVPQTPGTKCLNMPKCLNVFVTGRNYCTIVGSDLDPNSG